MKLQALTPPRGRGRRRIQDEAFLVEKAKATSQEHGVEGLLAYTFERQVEQPIQYIGRGRGSTKRPQQVIGHVRYRMTSVVRGETATAALEQTFGWRAYVTDLPVEQLSLCDAVLTYREGWQIEHGFHRLEGVPLFIALCSSSVMTKSRD